MTVPQSSEEFVDPQIAAEGRRKELYHGHDAQSRALRETDRGLSRFLRNAVGERTNHVLG
jgi:hypothetical protein